MTTPLAEYYKINREALPPEFSNPGVKVRVFLTGTTLPYRTLVGDVDFLKPADFPVQRTIALTHGGRTTYWTEDLEPNRKFNSTHKWVDLGIGVCPERRGGVARLFHHLAHGYLRGYPIKDVIYFAIRFGLQATAGQRILEREENKRSLGAEVLSLKHRARMANPLYDERDM